MLREKRIDFMKTVTIARAAGIVSVTVLGIGMVYARFAPGTNLYIDGAMASQRVFQHDGMACVPIADVAKALNQTVVPKADGYAINATGVGTAVGDRIGKIGEKLSNGEYDITVVKAMRIDKYVFQFDKDDTKPSGDSDDLVVVTLRMKSERKESSWLPLKGGDNTAVTDIDEHSYTPKTFGGLDAHNSGPTLLPGSAVDFGLIFSVPKTEKLGDFVYQISGSGNPRHKNTTFRISLASLNQ